MQGKKGRILLSGGEQSSLIRKRCNILNKNLPEEPAPPVLQQTPREAEGIPRPQVPWAKDHPSA